MTENVGIVGVTSNANSGRDSKGKYWKFNLFPVVRDVQECLAYHPQDVGPEISTAAGVLIGLLKDHCSHYVFQLEQCPTTARLHFEGAAETRSEKRFSTMRSLLANEQWSQYWTLGDLRIKNRVSLPVAVRYCQKPDSAVLPARYVCCIDWERIGEDPDAKIRAYFNARPLRPWQEFLMVHLTEVSPDDRDVYVVIDEVGNLGKSFFVKYMALFHKACWVRSAKSADINTLMHTHPKIVLIDIPRVSSSCEAFPYTAIEAIKDGLVSDGKLKKTIEQHIFMPPHVVVFTNNSPDFTKFSTDRWVVYHHQNPNSLPLNVRRWSGLRRAFENTNLDVTF